VLHEEGAGRVGGAVEERLPSCLLGEELRGHAQHPLQSLGFRESPCDAECPEQAGAGQLAHGEGRRPDETELELETGPRVLEAIQRAQHGSGARLAGELEGRGAGRSRVDEEVDALRIHATERGTGRLETERVGALVDGHPDLLEAEAPEDLRPGRELALRCQLCERGPSAREGVGDAGQPCAHAPPGVATTTASTTPAKG